MYQAGSFSISPRAVIRDALALCLPFAGFYGWLLAC